ncbi:hypothetical protein L596_014282 [Steinernema carpocapsae]|uniref:Uncharacterized protein n=1 Tax=Steinernema carpocapsae TaxID=34508 RepID=A0A4U5NC93_STECR|nr:hypothetical protein L596_014282 [Steinernema carpocapsae]
MRCEWMRTGGGVNLGLQTRVLGQLAKDQKEFEFLAVESDIMSFKETAFVQKALLFYWKDTLNVSQF